MSATVPVRTRPPIDGHSGNGSGGSGGGRRGGDSRRPPPDTSQLGVLFALAGIGMLFVALTSAYVVRMGTEGRPDLPVPLLLWANSAALMASSAALEKARRTGLRDAPGFRRWVLATLGLGLAFLAGQLAVWRSLAGQGVYLNSNPHSSFFYLLTAVHGLHLLGGLTALGWLAWRAGRPGGNAAGDRRVCSVTGAAATYWHFMGALWLYVLVLLFYWR